MSKCHHHAAPQIGEYAELGNVTNELVEKQEVEFTNEIKSRAEANGGKIKYVEKQIERKRSDIAERRANMDRLQKELGCATSIAR